MTFKEILDSIDSDAPARMKRKVPEWSDVPGMEFPTRLSTEQCSSSATARYKAALAAAVFQRKAAGGIVTDGAFPQRSEDENSQRRPDGCLQRKAAGGIVTDGAFPQRSKDENSQRRPDNAPAGAPEIIDLTGGLGVDCWAFSSIATHVHHNEPDPTLSAAVQHNFNALGITNATFSSIEAAPETIGDIITASGSSPDIIFLDPARRSGTGRKVFLLEDCSPDILTLKDELLAAAPDILVKLSPMADIPMLCKRLGPAVREVHVVSADGECKELLIWMQRGWNNGCTIVCGDLRFTRDDEAASIPATLSDEQSILDAVYLFEPSPALLKAGCFNLLCSRFALTKLGKFTHIYTAANASEELKANGKLFIIKEMLPFNGRSIKAIGKAWPRCEVTARNLPISSEELRKKMGVTSGGNVHIFACTASFESGEKRILLVTVKA